MAYTSMEVPEEIRKSKYNSAIAQLYRLDALWQDAHRHARQINYSAWNEDLDRIWEELSADAGVENKKVKDKINKELSLIFIYSNLMRLKTKKPQLYSKILLTQKKVLMKKEEFLRVLQNQQGKGTAYEESIEDYMD